MIKRETLEPLDKESIINIFVEFSDRIEKEMLMFLIPFALLQKPMFPANLLSINFMF